MAVGIEEVAPQKQVFKRIGTRTLLVRPVGSLDDRAVESLRDVYENAGDDATDLVVDLGTVDTVTVDGARELVRIAAEVHSRSGGFWIAAPRSYGDGYTLRPVQVAGPADLTGLSAPLDEALAGASP